ncbi:MAG: hypothetical protein H7Z43_06010 [Clostridia bacterium]|nr:hypothetical protein [Deltaproteobacteria bacterium]
MKMPQFDATIKYIAKGIKGFTVAEATKNIEGWEARLEKVEMPGAKSIIKDLENLKKHLHADELDGMAIGKLVAKLGKETVAIAKHAEGENVQKIESLGRALSHAVEKHSEKASTANA